MMPTLEDLMAKAVALPRKPVAFEAGWDGDSYGWKLLLTAIMKSDNARGYEDGYLAHFAFDDFRLFNGHPAPWAEAGIIRELGDALGREFGVPFYFPSPKHPEDDCPRWWEQEKGVPCRNCGIPLYQEDRLEWRGICYFCHLRVASLKRTPKIISGSIQGVPLPHK